MMIKRPIGNRHPDTRIRRITPPAKPGWYKRFRQLAALAGESFKLK